ncbi:MAG: hypothetical protein E7058_06150 [Lentisphaerae bacterium]|nr:hypothetical protein [Lentisphaerota bacterium]
MNVENFKITPRVVAADSVVEITVAGRFPHNDLRVFGPDLTLDAVGADGLFSNGQLPGLTCGNGYDLKRPYFEPVEFAGVEKDGILRFKYCFRGTGEHNFRLLCGESVIVMFSVFAVKQEFLKLRPFRGDMHLHSGYSCCCQEKDLWSPEYLAAKNCELGMDFISISDHKQYLPSLKAADFVEQSGTSFHAYPGEEVHLSDLHNIHVLNFGGNQGISCRLKSCDPEYARVLPEYLKQVPDFKDEWLNHMAANFRLIFDRIREADGVMVFCHPFWMPSQRLFMPECIREYVLEQGCYDCIEVFGDAKFRESNDLCAARYLEQCLKEQRIIPAVGNNDAHLSSELAINSTVVFARCNELSEIKSALREGRCVAVNSFANEFPRTSGSLELVAYYHFLRREYYPAHDEICRMEAAYLFDTLATGGVDGEFRRFIKQPYPYHVDCGRTHVSRRFEADSSRAAEIRRRREILDQEFWG